MATRFTRANPRTEARATTFQFNIDRGPAVSRDLGGGIDRVDINSDVTTDQIRLTFTSAEVGNGNPRDSNTLANQDGGLAVRVQAEGADDSLRGPISRFDDEGIIFTTRGTATFDVRDLVSGAARGDYFDVVVLGTAGPDTFNFSRSGQEYYVNGGMGNDTLTGGLNRDFLVGGAGNDTLDGGRGNDSFIGGGGNDTISGGLGNDLAIFNVSADGTDSTDLGAGDDTVNVIAPAGAQIRLTFTSAEVGNASGDDAGTLANQDGGLAVRLQLEGADDTLIGTVSRFDDEGITFTTTGDATFDVRDLVSGAARGDQFDAVTLGTEAGNTIDRSGQADNFYINGGGGDDIITGGLDADFLVGGAGNDRLNGREGNDTFIGGGGADTFVFSGTPGNDRINDFVSGTDKIDFSAYGITAANVTTATVGADTVLSVDSNKDGTADFQVTLVGVAAPAAGDYIL
jgi:Ca2+-binding RTX toxin-like protein